MYIAYEHALPLWWAKRENTRASERWLHLRLLLCATLTWLLETNPPSSPQMESLLAGSLRASSPFGRYREKSSLACFLGSRFPRPNRRACSQACLQANLNRASNQALEISQTSQKQFSDKHSEANSKTSLKVSFNFSGLWTLLCPSRPPTGMCSVCYCIKRINDMSFDLQFLSKSHQKTLVIFREGRQLKI